jgi:hypothetical protein
MLSLPAGLLVLRRLKDDAALHLRKPITFTLGYVIFLLLISGIIMCLLRGIWVRLSTSDVEIFRLYNGIIV